MLKFGILQQQNAILFALRSYKANLFFYTLLTFTFLLITFLLGGTIELSYLIQDRRLFKIIAFTIPVFSFLLQLSAPLIFFAANILVFQGKTPKRQSILSLLTPHYTVLAAEYIIVIFLYAQLVFLGTLLFIIPGIIFLVRYQFCTYLIFDKKYNPLKAMHQSAVMTKKNIRQLFLFDLTLGAFNVLGISLLGFGLLISIPISLLAFVYAYKYLLGELPNEQNPPRAYIERILS